jgi:hypothetical protein
MASFEDDKGRVWPVRVDVGVIRRVRNLLRVDLNTLVVLDKEAPAEQSLLFRLQTDPVLLVDVLFLACEGRAKELGVDDQAFGRMMAGDVIERATVALLEAIADFTPSPRLRKILRTVLRVQAKMMSRVYDRAERGLAENLEKAIEKALPSSTSTGSSGSARDSVE